MIAKVVSVLISLWAILPVFGVLYWIFREKVYWFEALVVFVVTFMWFLFGVYLLFHIF